MKKIVVTPAGRKKYLEILSKYLIKYKNEFDEWHLWCNTIVPEDVDYIRELSKDHDFIKIIEMPDMSSKTDLHYWPDGNMIHAFTIPYFIQVDSTDEDSVYLRLDDDILFIRENSIKNIFEYRINNDSNCLVYGNIINNSAISNLHQTIGVLPKTLGSVEFNAYDPISLYSGPFSELSHRTFFEKLETNSLDEYFFDPYVFKDYVLVSIQVISWLGKDYKKFDGIIPAGFHEENYQSQSRPEIENRKNVVYGDGLFCHYSAAVNRGYVDTTDILSVYKKISEEYLK